MVQNLFAKIFNTKSNKNNIEEAKPYVFEYDRPVPGFDAFTKNLIQQRYDTKRYSNTNESAPQTTKGSRRAKSRS